MERQQRAVTAAQTQTRLREQGSWLRCWQLCHMAAYLLCASVYSSIKRAPVTPLLVGSFPLLLPGNHIYSIGMQGSVCRTVPLHPHLCWERQERPSATEVSSSCTSCGCARLPVPNLSLPRPCLRAVPVAGTPARMR